MFVRIETELDNARRPCYDVMRVQQDKIKAREAMF